MALCHACGFLGARRRIRYKSTVLFWRWDLQKRSQNGGFPSDQWWVSSLCRGEPLKSHFSSLGLCFYVIWRNKSSAYVTNWLIGTKLLSTNNGKIHKMKHTNAYTEQDAGSFISERNHSKKESCKSENFTCGWGKKFLIDSSCPSIYRPLIISCNYFMISKGQAKSQHMLLIWGLKATFPKLGNLEASLQVQIEVESWMEKLGNCDRKLTHSIQPDFQQDVVSIRFTTELSNSLPRWSSEKGSL